VNIVTLPTLKKLRFAADDAVRLPKLQRWARDGRLPGAYKQTPDSDWMVDLDEFDAATAAAKVATRGETSKENRLFQMVVDELNRSGAT
jgi:hypothetical protein